MSKRVSRPWDRKGIGGPTTKQSTSFTVPSIQVDGVSYLSDRFYLNRADCDPPIRPTSCTCGARNPPPSIDRGRLVDSLDLKAAIVASFTVDTTYMQQELPSLFGRNAVPTLVLHGHKSLTQRMGLATAGSKAVETTPEVTRLRANEVANVKRAKLGKTDIICIDDSSDEEDVDMPGHIHFKMEKGETIQPPIFQSLSDPRHHQLDSEILIKEEEPPEEAWLQMDCSKPVGAESLSFGQSVHLTEILTTWLPPNDARVGTESIPISKKGGDVIVLDSDDESFAATQGVDPLISQRRILKRGVHHPKFMILFEKCGSVVIVVSTSNLTPQLSVDASWVQRFEPASLRATDPITDAMRQDGSDFGYVLANYLQCQSNAAREGQMIPEEFLLRYLNIKTLDDFRKLYRFEDSLVHLIATVPGEHRGRHSTTHLGRSGTSFLYGPQRVADILSRLSTCRKEATQGRPWLPSAILSKQDRLILQPTSFGGHWTRENLAEVTNSYLARDEMKEVDDAAGEGDSFDNIDILWPSHDFMEDVRHHRARKLDRVESPDSVADVDHFGPSIKLKNDGSASDRDTTSGFVFLSSKSFNTIDLSCISRMAMYESSIPHQTTSLLSPHIKSYARLFEGDDYLLRKDFCTMKSGEVFSWFMITSACLSRGAQGSALKHRGSQGDEMSYSNFELGVLFCSRLTSDMQHDRLYCFQPTKCQCNSSRRFTGTDSVKMIHLPIPYCLRARSYQSDPDEADMCATPFFHEIPEGTGYVGQMRLTPLGSTLASTLT